MKGAEMLKFEQRGRTMIEVIAVLGIISMVAVGIMAIINNVYSRYKNYSTVNQIQSLQKAISNRYAYKGNYQGISAKSLIEDKSAPPDMIIGEKLYHAMRREVVVAAANSGGTNRSYTILFPGLTKKICSELGAINWTVSDSTELVAISINDVKYTWPDKKGATGNFLPLDAVTAAGLCNSGYAADGSIDDSDLIDENKILWEFQ